MLVVHGNVKPQNVICETAADGGVRVVLADFGMAAKAGHAPSTLLHAGSPGLPVRWYSLAEHSKVFLHYRVDDTFDVKCTASF